MNVFLDIIKTSRLGIMIAFVLFVLTFFTKMGGLGGFIMAFGIVSVSISLGIELERRFQSIREKKSKEE